MNMNLLGENRSSAIYVPKEGPENIYFIKSAYTRKKLLASLRVSVVFIFYRPGWAGEMLLEW